MSPRWEYALVNYVLNGKPEDGLKFLSDMEGEGWSYVEGMLGAGFEIGTGEGFEKVMPCLFKRPWSELAKIPPEFYRPGEHSA